MKKRMIRFGIASVVLLAWAACNRVFDAGGQGHTLDYVSFIDLGCRGSGLAKTDSNTPYLSNHRLKDGFLTLTIHYSANCCPAFMDSVSIHDNFVDICLDDTSSTHCRCFCEYDNDFIFQYNGSDLIQVRFGWMNNPFELDTLIHVP